MNKAKVVEILTGVAADCGFFEPPIESASEVHLCHLGKQVLTVCRNRGQLVVVYHHFTPYGSPPGAVTGYKSAAEGYDPNCTIDAETLKIIQEAKHAKVEAALNAETAKTPEGLDEEGLRGLAARLRDAEAKASKEADEEAAQLIANNQRRWPELDEAGLKAICQRLLNSEDAKGYLF